MDPSTCTCMARTTLCSKLEYSDLLFVKQNIAEAGDHLVLCIFILDTSPVNIRNESMKAKSMNQVKVLMCAHAKKLAC